MNDYFFKDEELVPKILEFLRKKPHFFDESNPMFYDAIQKSTEKKQLAESFDPPLNLILISAKIRWVIHKVIDNFYLIKRGKKAKWSYFDAAKFMLPSLMTKPKRVTQDIALDETDNEDDNEDGQRQNKRLRKLSKMERKVKETSCKICGFVCPSNLYLSHFELRFHQKGEETWKEQNQVDVLQCPRCSAKCSIWIDLLKHLASEHELQINDINFRRFYAQNRILHIDLKNEERRNRSTARLYYDNIPITNFDKVK